MLAGGLVIWGWVVLLWHLSQLGVKDIKPLSQLAQAYSLGRVPAAGEFLGAMAGHLWHLALTALVAVGALGWGLAALRLLRLTFPVRGMREVLAGGAGFALVGLAMLGGGLAGLWWPEWPVVLAASGITMWWPRRGGWRALVPAAGGSLGGRSMQALAMAGGLLVVVIALVPEVFYDSLVYHLADPFNWAKIHKVTALPYNFFSNFPFTFEMLFGIGVLWGSDAVARLCHAAISLLAAGLLGVMAVWLAQPAPVAPATGALAVPGTASATLAGWIAAAIYLTTPLIANSAWMTGIDAGLVLYEAAAVLGFLLWWDGRKDSPRSVAGEPHWLVLAAVFGGLGMGAKYTVGFAIGLLGLGVAFRVAAPSGREALRGWLAAVVAGLLPVTLSNVDEIRQAAWAPLVARPLLALYAMAAVAALGWLARRWGWRRTGTGVWRAAVFGAVAFCFVSPWNAKAWLFTRCPTYPFAYKAFDSFHVSPPRMDYQMGEFREFRWRPAKEWLLHPWFITRIAGLSNNSACGGLFLALLPMLLLFRGVDPRIRLVGVFILGRYLLWSNVSNIVRYFAPGLALLGVLAGVYLGGLCARRTLARGAGLVLVSLFSVVNIVALLLVSQWSVSWFAMALGAERERDFLLRERPSYPAAFYAAGEAMNAMLPPRSGVLYVGEARGTFWRGRLVAATVFDLPPLIDVCTASRDETEMAKKFRQMGITHVFFSDGEAQRTAGYRLFDWPTPRARSLFERWWATRLRLMWKAGWLRVYEIRPAPVAERTAELGYVFAPFDEFDALQRLDRSAAVAMTQGRIPEANATALEVVRRAPGVARAHELLGQSYAYMRRDRLALDEFRRAVALGLISSQVHYNLAVVLRSMGRAAEAAREYGVANGIDLDWARVTPWSPAATPRQ